MNKTYFVAGFTAMMTLNCSKVLAFDVTQINIKCWADEGSSHADKTCHSATRTEDAEFISGETIQCLCPDDYTKLISYRCTIDLTSTGTYVFKWYTDGCYACSAGYYNNGEDCKGCPWGYTSDEDAISKYDCYIPKDEVQSDEAGTFVYTDNCYYTGNNVSDEGDEEENSSTTTTAE